MSPHRPFLARAAAVAVATLLASVVLAAVPAAYAVSSHRALNDTRPVGVGAVAVGFPIEYFGLVADLPSGAPLEAHDPSAYGQARFRVDGAWTAWQDLDQDGAQSTGHFTGALVSVDRATAYQVRNLPAGASHWRAAAINTTDGPTLTVGKARSDAASASASCRSRADWGADESLSGWAKGDTQTYFPLQALTVHHTAGSNDLTQDYGATVRAIYSYHVQTNGWSDIGYQYLVDGHGVVYEGRNSGHTSRSCLYDGGDGSDFAHQTSTDQVVTGAHVANYNSGNAGVALMGCYEPTTACSGSTTPPTAAVDGLEGLLASLATRHGLKPTGSVHYVNPVTGAAKDVATISGHRDWEATACPGGNLYAQLPTIRSDVASRMAGSTATAPAAPSSLTASGGAGSVALSWTAPTSDGGAAISRYEVFRGATSTVSTSTTPIYSGSATSATDKPAAGSYYYAVRACNSVGCGTSASAGPVTVTTPATITSASCSGATCTFAGQGTPTLTWTFGNGKGASGSPVSVTYAAKGSYTVTLTDGQQSRATRTVQCSLVKKRVSCTT
ncbi:N-acetylmuramoyl-L-alanine amidase [Nocardioides pocheonensis]|uniref:PKD domain-containing protein n=1 Tax=Nocardioides pocheonensis TaxID=661485 RepID=A0A3N0GV42_9ACTN|nr:N-acetylmuramoyl-L-alanine amidase [Nocardioides pocheonensis]RNM16325.1 PKD domain-containing protein [Nocardioides pocheonensis]